jgi:hypothetical protein
MNIARNFRLTERFTLQFRGEFVNIFNRTELPNPITSTNPTVALTRNPGSAVYGANDLIGGFGVINAFTAPNTQFGTTTSAQAGGAALAPRSGTLVLRLQF